MRNGYANVMIERRTYPWSDPFRIGPPGGSPVLVVPQRRPTSAHRGPLKESTNSMTYIVLLMAALNRPTQGTPVGQYSTHTTHEEMLGLL